MKERIKSMNLYREVIGRELPNGMMMSYRVYYSYSTPIALQVGLRTLLTSPKKYSQTTSKQKTYLLRELESKGITNDEIDHEIFTVILRSLGVDLGLA